MKKKGSATADRDYLVRSLPARLFDIPEIPTAAQSDGIVHAIRGGVPATFHSTPPRSAWTQPPGGGFMTAAAAAAETEDD